MYIRGEARRIRRQRKWIRRSISLCRKVELERLAGNYAFAIPAATWSAYKISLVEERTCK